MKRYRVIDLIFNNKVHRRLILILGDLLIIPFSIIVSLYLKYDSSLYNFFDYSWLFFFITFFSIPLYILLGQYKSLSSYFGLNILISSCLRNILISLLAYILGKYLSLSSPPISLWILIVLNITSCNLIFRYFIRKILISYSKNNKDLKTKIAIYGAGISGVNLATSLNLLGTYRIITFFDQNKDLWKRNIAGIPIKSPEILSDYQGMIDKVLISIDNLSRIEKFRIIEKCQNMKIPVLVIPSVNDVEKGIAKVNDLRPININDIVARRFFQIENKRLNKFINNKVICVTGAGGSIGSELCSQILLHRPKKIILLDRSEINLYNIREKLNKKNNDTKSIRYVLGCATDKFLIEKLFSEEKVQIVFHAAAYKHVPIVEENPLQGIKNNVISTAVVCNASYKSTVENFCLISTDKAVRPTNVMGASKRLAELIVQSYAHLESSKEKKDVSLSKTTFSMVRFGNVLDSSGSVVPKFREQISKGGPLTVTDPQVMRYFMTISEAANLVLESTLYSKGGDLFLLDMGEPVLIKDLASQMIKLSGLKIKDHNNPSGDIEIAYSGLRPGEKLYEELLIDAEAMPTENKYIFRAKENFYPYKKFFTKFKDFEESLRNKNENDVLFKLAQLVPEWKKNSFDI